MADLDVEASTSEPVVVEHVGAVRKRPAISMAQATIKRRRVSEEGLQSAPAIANPKARGKPTKINGMTLEQHRRDLGDTLQGEIRWGEWTVASHTHASTMMSTAVFDALVRPHASEVTEVTNDLFLVHISGPDLGEMCGRSKISGGNYRVQLHADEMVMLYYPESGTVKMWWTMGRSKPSYDGRALKKAGDVEGVPLEKHRRALGDAVKGGIHWDQHAIQARLHVTTLMDEEVLNELVLPHAASVTKDSKVVVVTLEGDNIGAVCGKSKISHRYHSNKYNFTWGANTMLMVWTRATCSVDVWWTMDR